MKNKSKEELRKKFYEIIKQVWHYGYYEGDLYANTPVQQIEIKLNEYTDQLLALCDNWFKL